MHCFRIISFFHRFHLIILFIPFTNIIISELRYGKEALQARIHVAKTFIIRKTNYAIFILIFQICPISQLNYRYCYFISVLFYMLFPKKESKPVSFIIIWDFVVKKVRDYGLVFILVPWMKMETLDLANPAVFVPYSPGYIHFWAEHCSVTVA